jgi:hypothetical protein
MTESVEAAIARLGNVVAEAAPRLRALSDAQSSGHPPGMGWSRKQILGHLIDSAGNNHQRFVRGQFQDEMSFPRYAQDDWVAARDAASGPGTSWWSCGGSTIDTWLT